MQFTVDTSVPSVTISTPTASSYNRSSLLINATASDAYTNITAVRFRLVGASPLNTTDWTLMSLEVGAKTVYNATFATTTILDGSYNVQVYANDSLNNTNSTTQVAITVDNSGPGIVSWNYSMPTKTLAILFNETVIPSTINLAKLYINWSDGSKQIEGLVGATASSANASTNSALVNITLTSSQDNSFRQITGTQLLYAEAGVITDLAYGSSVAKSNLSISNLKQYTLLDPTSSNWQAVWNLMTIKYTRLQDAASSLGSNYSVQNVMSYLTGTYARVDYMNSSGSWFSYVPNVASTFTQFNSDTGAYWVNLTTTGRLQIP